MALLSCASVTAAARRAGVSARTLRRWLAAPEFGGALAAAKSECFSAAMAALQRVQGAAVRTLRRNLRCGHAATEIRAALGLLAAGFKETELSELTARLSGLEERLRECGLSG